MIDTQLNSKHGFRFLATIAFLLGCSLNLAAQNNLKVMTYNIRYNNTKDGENAWPKRKEKVAELINGQQADVIGLQEALADQVKYLDVELSDYGRVGVGRDDGRNKGEFSPIYFLKEKYQLRDNGTFWLSETPEKPGSKSWDAAITRICTYVELIDVNTGIAIWFFNTHFDHKGHLARAESAKLLMRKARELASESAIVLLGDFNFKPNSEPYRIIVEGFLDSFLCRKDGPETTGVGFAVNGKEGNRIDHIFHSELIECSEYRILDDSDGQHYPSDHLPVVAKLLTVK
jgi:endonuclease/exonuclease/phosphatase family metal-dependent hydrolase